MVAFLIIGVGVVSAVRVGKDLYRQAKQKFEVSSIKLAPADLQHEGGELIHRKSKCRCQINTCKDWRQWKYTYNPLKLFFELYILLLVTSFMAFTNSGVNSFGFGLTLIISTIIIFI